MNAETLNCPTCGAAIQSDASQCRYCGAHLATVACPKCFGRAFLGSKFCPHCGATLDTAAPETPVALICPRCRLALARKRLGDTALMECDKCSGIWIDDKTFQNICNNSEQQSAVLGEILGPAPRATIEQGFRYLPCPKCKQLMNRVNFGHSSGVIIDICKPHGIWFDCDELRKIVEFIRAGGLDRARQIELQKLQDAQMRAARGTSDMPDASDTMDSSWLYSRHHQDNSWVQLGWVLGWLALSLLKLL